jgi:hypothetical protein
MNPVELTEFVSYIQTLGLTRLFDPQEIKTVPVNPYNDYCTTADELDSFILNSIAPGNIQRTQLYLAYKTKFAGKMTEYEMGRPECKGGQERYKTRIYTRLEVLRKDGTLNNVVLKNTYTAS